MAVASFVASTPPEPVAVEQATDGLKVVVRCGTVTVFIMPEDAMLIGAQIITVASQIKTEIPF